MISTLKVSVLCRKNLLEICFLTFISVSSFPSHSAQNVPPNLSGSPITSIAVGKAYQFIPKATDLNRDKLTFKISNKPVWATFNVGTGALTGIPKAANAGVTKLVNISVTDGKGGVARLPSFNLTVLQPNRPPVISGLPITSVNVGQVYNFKPVASDPDKNVLNFSIANKPAWASFNAASGALSGTPAAGNVGSTPAITISVSDGKGGLARLAPFNLSVIQPNRAPVISGVPGTSVNVGQAYSFTPPASDLDKNALTFSITNKPVWASFNTVTGTLSGTPGAGNVGTTSNIKITVSDGKGGIVSLVPFNLTVVQPNRLPLINGIPTQTVTTGVNYNFTPTASDPDGDKLTFNIANKPAWAAFDATTGFLNGIADKSDGGQIINNIVISVTDGKSAPVSLPTFSLKVTALPYALQTGDASHVTIEELLSAGIVQAQTEQNYCLAELGKIYPGALQQTMFPTRSAYMASNSSRNIPLHSAKNNGSVLVYSWMGKKNDGTPYAVLGANVFSLTPVNTDLKASTLNLFYWLLNKDKTFDILSQPLVILVPNSADRTALQTWFTANGLSKNWTVSSDAALLDSGNFDLYLADIDYSLPNIKKAFSARKPVLAFNYWYHPNDAALAEFDLSWSWYGSQTVGNYASAAEQCAGASVSPQIEAMLTTLRTGVPDVNYESADCQNSTGTITCDLNLVTDSQGNSIETLFNQGATAVRNQLKGLDKAGLNIFALNEDNRLLKLMVLLGDKYRENIHYPMDKIATDDNAFYHALFADNAVHYARPDNFYQPDMGDFTDAQSTLGAAATISKTLSFTPTVFDEWTGTGLYAPPGKTITVRRTDNGSSEVKLRFNYLRESTKLWNPNQYSRPRYMASTAITLKAGQTYNLSTPYGGPIYLGWTAVQTGATPFTVEISNVLDNPLLQSFDDNSVNFFLNEVEATPSDWIDLKTPYSELHTLKSNMLTAFSKQDGNSSNGYTYSDVQAYISDLNNYLIMGNYAYAGFTGDGLPQLNPEVQTFCEAFQLTEVAYDGASKNLCTDAVIHAKPKIQHINSDVHSLCGSLCSGNPFDSDSAILPLDWGENHEMGHNLQRARLKIYGSRSSEVSNNIFPLHTQWQWTVAQGLSKHPNQSRPANSSAFAILQNAIKAGTAANSSHPLWSGTGTYDNAFERLSFYMQLAYTQQSWDVYTKLYVLERIYTDALQSQAKWDVVKNRLGFGNYTLVDAANISANDFMYVAVSVIGARNYSDFFEAWGIELTQAAKDQVLANNITTQVPKRFYYVNNALPAVMPTDADTISLDGINTWADPTP